MPSKAALIVADEAAKAGATPLLAAHYEIFILGEEVDFSARPIVFWKPSVQNGLDWDEWAAEVAEIPRGPNDVVKVIEGEKQPQDFSDLPALREWSAQHSQVVSVSPPPALSGVSEQQGSCHNEEPSPSVAAEYEALPFVADPGGGESIPYEDAPPFEEFPYERPSVFVFDEGSSTWQDPLDITTVVYRGRPFQMDMLPDALRAFVLDESESKGTDPGISALAALAACAGVANDAIKLQVNQHDPRWLVRACIWTIMVGNPSTGKTPAIESCMHFAQKLDAELCKGNALKMEKYLYALDAYADAKRVAIKEGKTEPPPKPDHPEIEQIWLDKATMEGARDVLQYSPRGVLWYRDEWSGAIAELDRYSKKGGGSGDRQRFLKLFDGGVDKQNLADHRQILLPNWSAVVCGGIQPAAIVKYLGELENDGLLQRTLICMARAKKPGRDRTPNWLAMKQFEKILIELRHAHGSVTVRMSEEAAAVRNEFVQHMATRIKYEQNLPLASHMGKWEGYSSRMMLLYHLIDRASKGQQPSDSDVISGETAKQVVRFFLDWQLSHIQEFWNELMNEKVERNFACTIARLIMANPGLLELSLREHVYKPHWSQWDRLSLAQRKEALGVLINSCWIVPKGDRRNGEGLHTTYMINPKVHVHFAEEAAEERIARQIKREELEKMREESRRMKDVRDGQAA